MVLARAACKARRPVICFALAGLMVAVVQGYGYWALRHQDGPLGPAQAAVSGGLLLLTGLVCGLISRRYADAVASWAGAMVGWGLVYWANYSLFPGWAGSDSSLGASVLLVAAFLVPVIAATHLVGAWLTTLNRQRVVH